MANVEPGVIRRWLREPLCRFLLLGVAVLAVDRAVGIARPPSDGDALRIAAGPARKEVLARTFRAEHGRAPGDEELADALDRWIDEEVLYREALVLGLDRRDAVVQRELTRKMRFLIEDATPLPEPSAADLAVWLERHPERYGRGPTTSFEHVFVSRGRHGPALEAEAARVAEELRRSPAAFARLGDPFPAGRVVASADAARIRRELGPGFDEALARAPEREWSGPIPSAFGLHFVRVTARSPFVQARLEDVTQRVRRDYDLARRAERNRAAVAELRSRYRITAEDAAG
jgi:hypothetical protein